MNVPPWLVFALVLTLGLALAYQLISRGRVWKVLLYWALILAGFLGGEIVSELAGWDFTRMGDLRLAPDLVGAAVILAMLRFMHV